MLSISKRILMSFTVFAMFFGAGNLIFPVFLAYQAGEAIVPAFFGFALSAIGLPVLALVAITRTDGLGELAGRAGSRFSRLFTIAVYLAIGPCLAIPRTASTSYEMVELALGTTSTLQTIAYCVLFFTLAALVARRPEKLSSRLGRILAPLLVLLIVVLTSGTVVFPSAGAQSSSMQSFQTRAFSQGFVDGYQTMDAIAGLVFGTILALNVEKAGCEHRQTRRECMIASMAGGVLILVVYLALAIVGCASRNIIDSPTNGAQILSAVSSALFPTTGRFLIAAIFILACFNTCVGLLSSCGQYFSTIMPKVSRDRWIAGKHRARCHDKHLLTRSRDPIPRRDDSDGAGVHTTNRWMPPHVFLLRHRGILLLDRRTGHGSGFHLDPPSDRRCCGRVHNGHQGQGKRRGLTGLEPAEPHRNHHLANDDRIPPFTVLKRVRCSPRIHFR